MGIGARSGGFVLPQGLDNLGEVEATRGEPIRVQQDARTEGRRSDGLNVPHARDPFERPAQLDLGIVAEVAQVVVFAGQGRPERGRTVAGAETDVHAALTDRIGELRQGEADAILHQHRGNVGVDLPLEVDRNDDPARPTFRADRRDAVQSAQLLLQRRGHDVHHYLRRRPFIGRDDADGRSLGDRGLLRRPGP